MAESPRRMRNAYANQPTAPFRNAPTQSSDYDSRDAERTLHNRQADLLTLLETLYNSRNPTRRWLHCTRRDWIAGKIREFAGERPGRALEIGFGGGVYLAALAEAYREVVASDLDQAHIEHARTFATRYPNLHLVTDDITDSHLPERSFDLILCSEVIEHIGDGSHALRAIRKLIAPEGVLIISTPQRHSLMELACKVAFMPGVIDLVRKIYGEAVFETGHINLMTEREIRDALEQSGFSIRECFKSGLYIPAVAEFCGQSGLRLEQWLENKLRQGPLSWSLWTQYYIAQA
jgi:2-polyprenyl-3-methyl-5-hydroxy-6-metoxy-1,4-benzoquinol methylase